MYFFATKKLLSLAKLSRMIQDALIKTKKYVNIIVTGQCLCLPNQIHGQQTNQSSGVN